MITKVVLKPKLHKEDKYGLEDDIELSFKVFSGSLWNLGSQSIILLSSLVSTPFTIRLLGTEAYGIFSLLSLLIGYLAVADFGMGQAAIRFGAEAYTKEGRHSEVPVIWTSLLVLLIPVSLAASCLLFAAPSFTSKILKLPVHLHQETVLSLRVAALGLLSKSISGVLMSSQYVRMRADLYSLVNTLSAVGQIILIPAILFWGGGLFIATVTVVSVNLATVLINGFLLQRLLPEWGKPQIRPQIILPLLRFGGATSLMTLMGITLFHLEKLLLVRDTSVVMFAYYSVAFNIARLLAIFPAVMGQPLLPAFTKLHADGTSDMLQNLYCQAVRGLLFWLIPVSLIICAFARSILGLWAGEEFSQQSLYPFYILVVGTLFDGVSYVPRILLSAIGRPGLIARFQIVNLIPYVFFAWALIRWAGMAGAAIAWTTRAAVECLMAFYSVRRSLEFSISPRVSEVGKYVITLVALLGVAVYGFKSSVALMSVINLSVIAALMHVAMIWKFILNQQEKTWIDKLWCTNLHLLKRGKVSDEL